MDTPNFDFQSFDDDYPDPKEPLYSASLVKVSRMDFFGILFKRLETTTQHQFWYKEGSDNHHQQWLSTAKPSLTNPSLIYTDLKRKGPEDIHIPNHKVRKFVEIHSKDCDHVTLYKIFDFDLPRNMVPKWWPNYMPNLRIKCIINATAEQFFHDEELFMTHAEEFGKWVSDINLGTEVDSIQRLVDIWMEYQQFTNFKIECPIGSLFEKLNELQSTNSTQRQFRKLYWYERRLPGKLNDDFGILTNVRPDLHKGDCHRYLKFYKQTTKILKMTIYWKYRINIDVCCTTSKGFTCKDNCEILTKCGLEIDRKAFLENHSRIISDVCLNYGIPRITKANNYDGQTRNKMRELLDSYPSFQQWYSDYEYGGCSDSEEESIGEPEDFEEQQIDRYQKQPNGDLLHYFETIKVKKTDTCPSLASDPESYD